MRAVQLEISDDTIDEQFHEDEEFTPIKDNRDCTQYNNRFRMRNLRVSPLDSIDVTMDARTKPLQNPSRKPSRRRNDYFD